MNITGEASVKQVVSITQTKYCHGCKSCIKPLYEFQILDQSHIISFAPLNVS